MNRLIVFLVTIISFSSCSTKDVNVADYPIITTVKDINKYYNINLDTSGNYEKTNLTKYIDGSYELEYTYDLLYSNKFDPLFYSITIEKETSISDAKSSYKLGKSAVRLMGTKLGQDIIEIDSIALPGDENFYAIRTYEKRKNGMYFTTRKGKFIYTFIISGLYTEDGSLLNSLILPKIKNIENFKIN